MAETANETRVGPEHWSRAVADTDGHQIVVAGPGTGKTEFLVRRVGHLITELEVPRDQVVVLCFSRRASADIGRRIETQVGGSGISIDTTTFHSLALRLVEAVAAGERPTPLTTPEQIGVVASILETENPKDWPVTYHGILTTPAFAAEVADFLMRCSERLLTPSDLDQKADVRADWRGIPGLFRRYLEHLSNSGRTDYGTLLATSVELLRSPAGADMAKRFRYVLVDEYQDTSPAQAAMADLLAGHHGNLTVAGDPYQSIYSFRGAELRNIAQFTSANPDARRLVLTKSFRVPQAILDSALRVVSGGELPAAAGPVEPAPHEGRTETYLFDQETAEAEWIAREVEHSMVVDGIRPEAIAVLVRSKKQLLNELSRSLARRGIPHDPPDSRLVDHPAVRLFGDLTTAAQHGGSLPATSPLEASDADRAMRRVLLGPMLSIGLGQERALLRERHSSRAPWAQVIRDNLEHRSGLADLLDSDKWATGQPAVDGFWEAWTSLDDVRRMVEDPERRGWRRAWTAFVQVLSRQAERDPNISLARFFELTEDEEFEATPLISHRPKSGQVALTTLHQAKGLEFDIVFIANAVESVFPDLRRGRRMLRPEFLSPERTTDSQAQHLFQLQEEMRLAYTAMTRARLRVVWTATAAGVDQGERRPSRFVIAASGAESLRELGPPPQTVRDPVTISEAETALRRDLLDPSASIGKRLSAAAVLARPSQPWWDPEGFAGVAAQGPDSPILGDQFRLSPSQADSYKRCPRQYALERRLRLGDGASPYALFGSLVHDALERSEREILGTGKTHADLDRALKHLEDVWGDASFGTPELNAAWHRKAVEAVTKLYQNWPNSDGIPISLETQVEAVINDIQWIGIIDRIEETPDGLRIVDYKTSTSAMPLADAAESVQLGFYATAVRAEGRVVTSAQLWYPRNPNKTVATRDLNMDRIDEVHDEMTAITEAIRREDWAPKIGAQCDRCSFRLSCPAWPEGSGAFLP